MLETLRRGGRDAFADLLRTVPDVAELEFLDVRTRAKWRAWLARHHKSSRGVWLVFHKAHTGVKSLPYEDGDFVGLHVRPQRDAPGATLLLHPSDVVLERVQIDIEGRGVEVERVHYRAFLAMHSISTAMPPGSAPAWIVVRAGNGAVKYVAYTSFIAAKSLMLRR